MRPVFILLATIMFMHFGAAAQRQQSTPAPKQVFTYVEQMPEFPGGIERFKAYLANNMRYPDSARAANIQGRVVVKFMINEVGNVDSVKVLRGIGYGCDDESVKVVKSMPRWKPGYQGGKPVRVYFTVPLTFELPEYTSDTDSTTHH